MNKFMQYSPRVSGTSLQRVRHNQYMHEERIAQLEKQVAELLAQKPKVEEKPKAVVKPQPKRVVKKKIED